MTGIVCAFFHAEGKGFYSNRWQRQAELNSHARLACYTMNKTGVASGNFYKKILFPM